MERVRYLSRLSAAAYWFLPRGEAREVVEDYREILHETACPDAALTAEFGRPTQAARALVQPKQYRRWLAAFGAMALCLLLPVVFLFCWEHHPDLATALLPPGAALAMIWFRREAAPRGPMPRVLPTCLLAVLLLAVGVLGTTLWLMRRPEELAELAARGWQIGRLFTNLLRALGALSLLGGAAGLICARLSDRRWCALYILCLTAAVICCFVLSVMHGMDLEFDWVQQWSRMLLRCCVTALAGCAACGVALC